MSGSSSIVTGLILQLRFTVATARSYKYNGLLLHNIFGLAFLDAVLRRRQSSSLKLNASSKLAAGPSRHISVMVTPGRFHLTRTYNVQRTAIFIG